VLLYTVYNYAMAKTPGITDVLTIRVPRELGRRLAREARRQRRTRSDVARALLASALETTPAEDLPAEARRQSQLASQQADERDVLDLITDVADRRGWE
jgi:predicted transcriptional regulator